MYHICTDSCTFQFRFKIMMGMGTELVKPCLTPDQDLNGDMISRIFSQKTVWLLPYESLNPKGECDVSKFFQLTF